MDSEGNIYFLPPPSIASPNVTPPPPFIYTAAPCSSLTLPTPPPRAPRARVSSQPLPCPAVPSCAPPRGRFGSDATAGAASPAGGTRALPPAPAGCGAPGCQAKDGAFACKHRFHPWDRGGRGLSVLKSAAAAGVSAAVLSRNHGCRVRSRDGGGCEVQPPLPGKNRGRWLSVCNITANRHGTRI